MACGDGGIGPTVLVVGDSLSAGYGIDLEEGWVALLESKLAAHYADARVINASISGDTTSGGRTRLKKALATHRPSLVIIELGGNDGLRGLSLRAMRRNLTDMVESSRAAGAEVALLGIRIPPNYGTRYADSFHTIYTDLASRYEAPMVDFFLEGVALNDDLMQADGIHPNAQAQPRLLDNAWPAVVAGLDAWCARAPAPTP